MPKGVYQRGSKVSKVEMPMPTQLPSNPGPVNTVTVSELPNRQSANANVESMRQTHGNEEVSTTERLFGDLEERSKLDETDPNRTEGMSQDPLREPEPVPQSPEEAEQPKFQQQPKPEESTPQEDDFIDWEKMSGKKIKQKIDGKEVVITAEELKKYSDQDQIKKHLAEAADKVGEERRRLAEERKQLQELRQQRQEQYRAPIEGQYAGQPNQASNLPPQEVPNPVLQRIQFLESQIQQMAQSTQPVIWQNNRQRVSDELKSQGFNDFEDYWPKIVANTSPELIQSMNGDEMKAAKFTYFQLKALDLQKTPANNVPRGTVSKAMENQPVPPVTRVDGGSPASGSHIDDSSTNYRTAFRRATALGDDKEAWNEVLRQKGVLPD